MWKFLLSYPVIWAITASSFYGIAIGKSHGSCNVTLDGKNGAFYPTGTNETSFFCFYTITEKGNGSVCVFFNSLFLDEGDEVNLFRNKEDALSGKNSIISKPIKAQNGSVTVATGLNSTTVVITGHNPSYIRDFDAYYTHECIIPVPPTVEILHSPIVANSAEEVNIIYNFNEIQHKRVMQAFTFLEFNMGNSKVQIDHGTSPGEYTNNPPTDFFSTHEVLTIEVDMKENSTDSFVLKVIEVDKNCSGLVEIGGVYPIPLTSPNEVLNNGSIVNECRWLVKHKDSHKILGLKFDTLDFHSVFDIVAVNDGLTELSSPLLQVTISNRNISKTAIVRSGAARPNLWISFKPVHYASHFAATVTVHDQGGYMKNEGKFSMTSASSDDTVFLLEVENDEIVLLTFDESSFASPANISIYDGFDTKNLLTTLHGQIKFPVLSRSSRMMVVGTKSSSFSASFKGVSPSCNQMSSVSTSNYILSENCNSTCTWVIPPQDVPNSELIVYLQYRSLKEGDVLEIQQLDATLTRLGLITSNTGYVPPVAVPANVGALIKVTQGTCKVQTDKIVLIGHSSILPGSNFNIAPKPSDELQISSPLYPDTYPLFSSMQWNITAPKDTFFHVGFQSMKLAPNHCVRIIGKEKYEFSGNIAPDDVFIVGDINIQFDSSNCDKKPGNLSLTAETGFQLNITVAECGGTMNEKSGEFNTTMIGSKSICIWKINVTNENTVDIITYSLSKKDSLKNQELTIYDGSSARDLEISNDTNSDIWSRSGILIVKCRRLNVSHPSSVYVFKYNTIRCNSSMLCENGKCMHPDWRCDGVDNCGDFSDERDCAAVPIPKNVTLEGFTSLAFWMCAFAMLLIGIIAGLTAPVCYQKYKDSRYTRFRELSGIDG